MKLADIHHLRWARKFNPVLKKGDSLSWDSRSSITPAVIKDNGKFLMYYTAQSIKGEWSICRAESENMENWRKLDKLVIENDDQIQSIDGAAILKSEIYYYMFFERLRNAPRFSKIISRLMPAKIKLNFAHWGHYYRQLKGRSLSAAHAQGRIIDILRSIDGINWQKFTHEEIISADAYSPCVIEKDDRLYLFYSKADRQRVNTHALYTLNLNYWEEVNNAPVLKCGQVGEWDESSATIVSIVQLDDSYLAFYEGEGASNLHNIGLATSEDLINWKKYSANPILTAGKKNNFDSSSVCSPHGILKDNKLYLFYTGYDSKYIGNIGLTIAEL